MATQLKLGYRFHNDQLRQNALTHSSYANENREKGVRSNERLEFLGDAVLGFICAEYIYSHFRHMPEGELTKLRASIVCEKSLYEYAQRLNLGEHLLLGHGEESGGGRKRPSVLADAVEAMLAAIYLDGGMEAAKGFILDYIKEKAETVSHTRHPLDYKTALQEIVQKNREETLTYRLKGESGPDHDKRFLIELLINSNVIAQGEGRSKKEAEQEAARQALELMGQ
ncbi:ribonuclease III [Intestinimonas butyriciproducens]|uniref:ribonuclease III n=1 Tax=Intestinimonas butyriciproducens TaxID=1297617 RepID=UPI000E4D5483|nr:ribonuclease III [Intestinimonas butyriciproducens]MBM6918646.1 ribonuclease III [Intestinimonas butyriciproducens]RHO55510.1 ribonuclease III [Ruminococcaceae bacterium AM07-15]